jgi:hypothetical protein
METTIDHYPMSVLLDQMPHVWEGLSVGLPVERPAHLLLSDARLSLPKLRIEGLIRLSSFLIYY